MAWALPNGARKKSGSLAATVAKVGSAQAGQPDEVDPATGKKKIVGALAGFVHKMKLMRAGQ